MFEALKIYEHSRSLIKSLINWFDNLSKQLNITSAKKQQKNNPSVASFPFKSQEEREIFLFSPFGSKVLSRLNQRRRMMWRSIEIPLFSASLSAVSRTQSN